MHGATTTKTLFPVSKKHVKVSYGDSNKISKPVLSLVSFVVLVGNGVWGSAVVTALRYYSDGPGIDSRWCH
jgi:hypothetical protein